MDSTRDIAMLVNIVWMSAFVAFLAGEMYATLIVKPLNTAAIRGSEVVMECSTNTTTKLLWRIQLDQIAYDTTLFDGSRFVGQFAQFYRSLGDGYQKSTLVMNATEVSAKRYTCEEPGFQSASAELVVLALDPVCSLVHVSASDDNFQAAMQCSVQYYGNWIPTMDWTQSYEIFGENSVRSAQLTESVRTIVNNSVLTSLIIITGKRREERLVYKCTTRFNLDQKPVYTTATNLPDYVHTWSSPALTISPGVHSSSSAPLLTIAVVLTVALIMTSTCLLILKRKLKGSRKVTTGECISQRQIDDADAKFGNREHNTGQIYDTIGVTTELNERRSQDYASLREQGKAVAMHEYVALADKKTNSTIEIPINDGLCTCTMDKTNEYADLRCEITEPSQNFVTRQSTSKAHDYLELVDDTASDETSSKQKTQNAKPTRGVYLDYLIPIQDSNKY